MLAHEVGMMLGAGHVGDVLPAQQAVPWEECSGTI